MNASKFNLQNEISKAWQWCWAYYCGGDSPRQQWLTATDLERRVRAQAAEQLHGQSYGSDAWGSGVRITGLNGLTLLDHCRNWLRSQFSRGILRADHPGGRHTCTGLRYRPVEVGLTAAEQRTIDTPAEERSRQAHIVHWQPVRTSTGPRTAECQKNKPPRRATYRRAPQPWTTADASKITCKKCQKLAAKDQAERVAKVIKDDHCSHGDAVEAVRDFDKMVASL